MKEITPITETELKHACRNAEGFGEERVWSVMLNFRRGYITKIQDVQKVYGIGRVLYAALVKSHKQYNCVKK